MAQSMLFRCCDPSITTIYIASCGGGTSSSCAIPGKIYKLIINNVRSEECWEALGEGYYPDAVYANIQYDASYEPFESCNECLKYNYKLYNCFDDTIVYTNYLECPECINWINNLAYTDLEPNPCWYVTVTNDILPEPPVSVTTYTCDVTGDAADDTYMDFKISINGIIYSMGNLWNQVSYAQLETDLNALTVGGQPLGQFTVSGEPYDNAVGRITVVGTNSYDYIVLDYGSPFNVPFTCTSVTTPTLPNPSNQYPGPIVPVDIITGDAVYCEPCEGKCYTITGTGVITYFDGYSDLSTANAPAVICSGSYPSVTGTDYEIFTNNLFCDNRNPCAYYYELTNCETGVTILSNEPDLAFPYALGETVKLAEYPGACWTIEQFPIVN